MLRRAGLRTLSLTPAIEPARLRRALRALDPERGRAGRTRRLARRDRPARLRRPRGAASTCGLRLPRRAARHRREHRPPARRAPAGGARRAGRAAPGAVPHGAAAGRGAGSSSRACAARSDRPPAGVSPGARGAGRHAGASYNQAPMPAPHRPVDPRASFPELEERVLARWRERDVFAESVRRRRGAPPWGFYEGPPTANGPPGIAPRARARLQGHLPPLPDDVRLLRRAQGRLGLPRPAGRAGGRGRARDASPRSDIERLRDRRVQRPLPRVGPQPRRGLDRADRADRLLGRPRRRLPHARRRLHRVGLVGARRRSTTRACCTRSSRSSRTARAAAPRSRATSSGSPTSTRT